MSLKIVRNDITKMNTEAIVNTASPSVAVGQGCDTAIYKAAGYDDLLAYRKENIGEAKMGEAFITPGFNLPSKYIIHAVSPLFTGGDDGEEDKLRSCYRNSLKLAKENGIKSISFPLISTGSFGYPKHEGLRVAADEINAFLLENEMEIYLVVFDENATKLGKKLYPRLESYINNNYVDETIDAEYSMPPEISRGRKPKLESRMQSLSSIMPSINSRESSASSRVPMVSSMMPAPRMRQTVEAPREIDFENLTELDERMKHLSDTFSEYLMYLIESKGMKNSDVYNRALIDKRRFSKIKNDPKYHPEKITALCLCIGAKLNLDETKDLLARAGYALSPCDKTDIIFSFFIENEIYDMIELDIQLEERGLNCIIA